ncbi:MAG: mycothione reductase [Ornithinimicrobium sp.]
MSSTEFDLIIIGSGSGNALIGPEHDDKRVAVVESGAFGGTCLNVGCIPTKMFVYAAEVARSVATADRYGIQASLDHVRWADIRDRIFGRIDPISEGGRDYRRDGENTTLYAGRAEFTGPNTLLVRDLPDGSSAQLSAPTIVIATGSSPVLPPVATDTDVDVHTSDTVMRLATLPGSMLIVGGGYISAEFAHVFADLGVKVTVVHRGETLLREQDEEISSRFTTAAEQQWDVRLGTEVEALRTGDHDSQGIVAQLSDGTLTHADVVLFATGRAPNSGLGLEAAGIDVRDDGRVAVDEFGRTSAAGVWALGDVSSPYQLKHVANAEARVVAHNLAHPDDLRALPHDVVPAAVFTQPQIAAVGMTEAHAREAGHDVTVKVQAYGDTAYGWAMEDNNSVLKLVGDRSTGLLLGAHFLGPQASSLIQPLVQAMSYGLPAADLARGQYWIHPALAEVVENALLGLDFD